MFLLAPLRAHAQRANENAVAEASDAFGTTIGRETIGLYTTMSARGFSPQQAGNLRISGLYYDQVNLSNPVSSIVRGSTVHVGTSAQGYPFPAPTGVVDYQLRTPAAVPSANVLLGYASYDMGYAELDVEHPVGETLSVGAGAGYAYNTFYKYGVRSSERTTGAIARWQPTDAIVITPFWGMNRHVEEGEKAIAFIGTSGVPRFRAKDLPAQRWADWVSESKNFGVTVRGQLSRSWLLDAGLFRSANHTPINHDAYLKNMNSLGEADYSLSTSPPLSNGSTSGEVRLTKRIDSARIRNNLYFSVKGRNRRGESGGADVREFGRATATFAPFIEPPEVNLGSTTHVTARQVTPGVAYEGIWKGVGQVSLGLQKSFYRRSIVAPGSAELTTTASPWIYNVGAAFSLTKKLTVYASSTRGFEEAGSAPKNAANRDEALPAQTTKQVDAGIKYQLTPSLQLVAGVFEIDKPYSDLDQASIFRQVGSTSNRGVEISLSGALTERLTIVSGLILIDPEVEREISPTVHTRTVAIGPQPGLFSANLQYRPRAVAGLVLDTRIQTISSRYARYGSVSLPAVTTVDAGVRYNTHLFGNPATYRLQLTNLTNEYQLTPMPSGQINALDGRRFELSLAMDF